MNLSNAIILCELTEIMALDLRVDFPFHLGYLWSKVHFLPCITVMIVISVADSNVYIMEKNITTTEAAPERSVPQNLAILAGNSISLTCHSAAADEMTYIGYGNIPTRLMHVKLQCESRNCSWYYEPISNETKALRLENVKASDTGYFSCRYSSTNSTKINYAAQLVVYSKLKCRNITKEEDGTVEGECSVSYTRSNQKPTLLWRRNNTLDGSSVVYTQGKEDREEPGPENLVTLKSTIKLPPNFEIGTVFICQLLFKNVEPAGTDAAVEKGKINLATNTPQLSSNADRCQLYPVRIESAKTSETQRIGMAVAIAVGACALIAMLKFLISKTKKKVKAPSKAEISHADTAQTDHVEFRPYEEYREIQQSGYEPLPCNVYQDLDTATANSTNPYHYIDSNQSDAVADYRTSRQYEDLEQEARGMDESTSPKTFVTSAGLHSVSDANRLSKVLEVNDTEDRPVEQGYERLGRKEPSENSAYEPAIIDNKSQQLHDAGYIEMI